MKNRKLDSIDGIVYMLSFLIKYEQLLVSGFIADRSENSRSCKINVWYFQPEQVFIGLKHYSSSTTPEEKNFQ